MTRRNARARIESHSPYIRRSGSGGEHAAWDSDSIRRLGKRWMIQPFRGDAPVYTPHIHLRSSSPCGGFVRPGREFDVNSGGRPRGEHVDGVSGGIPRGLVTHRGE